MKLFCLGLLLTFVFVKSESPLEIMKRIENRFGGGFGEISSGGCKDSDPFSCLNLKRMGFCTSYKSWMEKQCRKSCGFCKLKIECKDKPNSHCFHFAQMGFCKPGHFYRSHMKRNCRKSCRFCKSEESNTIVKCKQGLKFGGRYVPIGLVSLMPYTMKQYSWDDCVKAVQAKYPKAQGITMNGYPCNKKPCKKDENRNAKNCRCYANFHMRYWHSSFSAKKYTTCEFTKK